MICRIYGLKLWLLQMACLLLGHYVASQSIPRIEHFGLQEGMSQVSVNDLIRDKSGFVWIGTADGLNRFDGNVFKHFKNNVQDTTSISGNFITRITETSEGFWVGTRGNGINFYDTSKEIFRKFKLVGSSNNEIISSIVKDENNGVWITTLNNGLHYLKIDSDSLHHNKYLPKEKLSTFFKDDAGWYWIGGLNGEVYGVEHNFDYPEIKFNVVGNVQSFFRNGNDLFIGTYEGFFIYNIKTKKLIEHELEKSGRFKTMHVVDFLQEDKNSVWIGTGRGLYLFDLVNFQVIDKIEYQDKVGAGLSNNTVQSLLKLDQDLLLVGTANGLNFLDFKQPYFNNISKDKKGNHWLNDNVIFSIYKDKDLWVGTTDGGLNLITEKKKYYFIDDKNDPKTIAGSVVRAIVHDKFNQRMWFGTTRGLSMIDLKTFNPEAPKFINFFNDPSNSNTINSNFIMDLAMDANHNLWGATYEKGIFRLEYKTHDNFKFVKYVKSPTEPNSLLDNVANCIRVDSKKNLWVGTQKGLSMLNFNGRHYTNGIFKNYQRDEKAAKTLSNNAVNDILINDNGTVWVGTRNGLNRLNSDGTFDSWMQNPQFPNTLIYSIQDDLMGNLWMGTNDGIVKFEPNTNTFSHYDIADNIQGKEFDTHARFRDEAGNIYLGGIDGVTFFNPKDLQSIDQPVTLYFSKLRVKDNTVKASDVSQDFIRNTIEETSGLTINYDQFPFYLSYSSLDFRLNKNIQFAYKLLPLDKEWNFITDREIQFLSLPTGEYNLQVNGFSRGKIWSATPLEMKLKIRPPWYMTKLAFITYFLLALMAIYWFYKFTTSRKLAIAETARLKDIDQLKNSLYTNITHEFRTPLTIILGMVDNLKSKFSNHVSDEVETSLNMMKRNGENLLKMVNDMLDLTKLESGKIEMNLIQSDIVAYTRYLFESFESFANGKDIGFTFYSEEEFLVMDFDKDKYHAIITNLLMNAIKFTPQSGKIIIHMKTEISSGDDNLLVKVIDSGIGLSENDISKIFTKFYQADLSTTRAFEGTGIGLALTKELVELMRGTIEVKSKLNKGSEFAVQLPITHNAPIDNGIINIENKAVEVKNQNWQEPKYEEILIENLDKTVVLIIEDNVDIWEYLKISLGSDYVLFHAKNGKIGVEMALKIVPDIIICDVMMPVMDGFEACSILKQDAVTDHIPIIILTAKSSDKDRIEGLSTGVDAYLIKPFNKEELLTRVNHLVEQRRKLINKFKAANFDDLLTKSPKNPQSFFINKITSTILDELDNGHFGSTDLAKKMNISESQLYRKIKSLTDKSTAIFIRSIRLQKAKEFLETSDKSISEVAYSVGFNDPSWFSRAFKEEFGCAPSEINKP